MSEKTSMLNGWLDDWSKQLDELEKDSSKDEVMDFELFQKFTGFMMRFIQTPSKIFNLSKEATINDE
jgi:hypothetical protein|tara:strand:+ start:6724 stop:6924 length:201 start_codon:yes stop_codon:yes gene_type:complete